MFKTLLKKQFQQTFSFLYMNKRKNEKRSLMSGVGYALLMIYVIFCFMSMFFSVANTLCMPLVSAGLGWVYFGIMGLTAISLGVIGSIFMTYSYIYDARDNDLMLSLPVKPGYVLLSRMMTVYVQSFIFEGAVLLPTGAAYYYGSMSAVSKGISMDSLSFKLIISWILVWIGLSLIAQTISNILGWVIALISPEIKKKTGITVVISLLFIGAYFYGVQNMNKLLSAILLNGQSIGTKIKKDLYLVYICGKACEGELLSIVLFMLLSFIIFGIVYLIMKETFLKMATRSKAFAKKKYKKGSLKANSPKKALFKKELTRFFGTASYVLNCGLGDVFLVGVVVYAIIKKNEILKMINESYPGMTSITPLLIVAMVCVICSPNAITAPSISLEGKNLWILKTLPINTKDILKTKINLHMLITAMPAVLCTLILSILFTSSVIDTVLSVCVVILVVLFTAQFGIRNNLKHPNFEWTNEAYVIKQGMSLFITLFGGWAVLLACFGLYVVLSDLLGVTVFLLIYGAVFGIINALLWRWICIKGCKIFEEY